MKKQLQESLTKINGCLKRAWVIHDRETESKDQRLTYNMRQRENAWGKIVAFNLAKRELEKIIDKL